MKKEDFDFDKELEVELPDDLFNLYVGTTDKYNPRTFFIEGTTFTNPPDYEEGVKYDTEIRRIKGAFRYAVNTELTTNHLYERSAFVINLGLMNIDEEIEAETKVLYFDVTFVQKNKPILSIDEVLPNIKELAYKFLELIKQRIDDEGFEIFKNIEE